MTRRMMVTDQLASALEDLTGLEWRWAGFDQLDSDTLGYRVMGGAVDGDQVASPQREPGLTWALVVKRAAQAAAATVVRHDLDPATEYPRLLQGVTRSSRPGDPAFDTTLRALHWRLHAAEPSSDQLEDAAALWTAASEASGPQRAWMVLISALLRDPEFVTY
jgi:hypothetical protein